MHCVTLCAPLLQFEYAEFKRQQEEMKHLMTGAIRRMMNRKLSMAWEQWQQWYADIKDQQFKLAGALRRMMNRKLSMGWEQWQVRAPPPSQPLLDSQTNSTNITTTAGLVRGDHGAAQEDRRSTQPHEAPKALDGVGAVARVV